MLINNTTNNQNTLRANHYENHADNGKKFNKHLKYISTSTITPGKNVTEIKKQEENYAVIDFNTTNALKKAKDSHEFYRKIRSIFTKEVIDVEERPIFINSEYAVIWRSKSHPGAYGFRFAKEDIDYLIRDLDSPPELLFARGLILKDTQKARS
ncbi:hypothetical protein BK025_00105 [Sodalis sp. TME1]|nr:hypothetical protein BK025_00105 [Sodalis sp. TME1]